VAEPPPRQTAESTAPPAFGTPRAPRGDDRAVAQHEEAAGFVHRFDTDRGDLQQRGFVLELRERAHRYVVSVSRTAAGSECTAAATEVQVDARWAVRILAGTLSPLDAFERRLGTSHPPVVALARGAVGDRALRRVESRTAAAAGRAVEGRSSSLAS
jgi:hypothetical protein